MQLFWSEWTFLFPGTFPGHGDEFERGDRFWARDLVRVRAYDNLFAAISPDVSIPAVQMQSFDQGGQLIINLLAAGFRGSQDVIYVNEQDSNGLPPRIT